MGLFKRDRVWWMCVSTGGRQIRRSTGTSDRRLAEAILAKVRVNLVEGRYFDLAEEKQHTVGDLLDRYLKECSVLKAPASRQRDEQVLPHLRAAFGQQTLAELTPKTLTAFKLSRRTAGAAPATINKELGLLKAAFNVASREWEWCRDNPIRRITMERVNNARLRYLDDAEFARVLQACPEWLRPIVLVARYTGLRRQNVVMLRWDQIDLFRKVILLERTKNGDRLGVPVCETLMDTLRTLAKVRRLRSPYVFTQADGSPYPGALVSMTFMRACRRIGIDDFRFHDLRHTFASSLVQRGADLYRVQRLLGHRDGRMTQRYAHLSPENLREAVALLDGSYHVFSTIGESRQKGCGASP